MAKKKLAKGPPDLSSMTDEQFEDLVKAIFRAKMKSFVRPSPSISASSDSVIKVSPSGRGADEGRDLLITTIVTDCIASDERKWVVQCKHKARSDKSVQPSDFKKEFPFPDIVAHHKANGYLLVCSTRPSTKLQKHFENLTEQSNNPYLFLIWDYARVCEEINKHREVMRQFFPDYFEYQQKLVDGTKITKWAKEYGSNISPEAKAQLNNIIGREPNEKIKQISQRAVQKGNL
jgi:hypothetical protein